MLIITKISYKTTIYTTAVGGWRLNLHSNPMARRIPFGALWRTWRGERREVRREWRSPMSAWRKTGPLSRSRTKQASDHQGLELDPDCFIHPFGHSHNRAYL